MLRYVMKGDKKAKFFRLLTLITPLAALLIPHYSFKTAILLTNPGFEEGTNPGWGHVRRTTYPLIWPCIHDR
jgi:hypothetical protein